MLIGNRIWTSLNEHWIMMHYNNLPCNTLPTIQKQITHVKWHNLDGIKSTSTLITSWSYTNSFAWQIIVKWFLYCFCYWYGIFVCIPSINVMALNILSHKDFHNMKKHPLMIFNCVHSMIGNLFSSLAIHSFQTQKPSITEMEMKEQF